jgi:hypothetical protein
MFQNKVYEELEGILQGSDHSPMMKDLNEIKYLYISRETTEDLQIGKCKVARILVAEVF